MSAFTVPKSWHILIDNILIKMPHLLFFLPLHFFNVYFKDEIDTFFGHSRNIKNCNKITWQKHHGIINMCIIIKYQGEIKRVLGLPPRKFLWKGPSLRLRKSSPTACCLCVTSFFKASRPYSKVPNISICFVWMWMDHRAMNPWNDLGCASPIGLKQMQNCPKWL